MDPIGAGLLQHSAFFTVGQKILKTPTRDFPTHVSSPDFPWARSDSDRGFAAEFEQESQASSCVDGLPWWLRR